MVRMGFQLYNIMFTVIFLLAVSTVVMNLIRSGRQWKKDNDSPRLTVPVTVVAKREDHRRRRNGNHTSYSTYYYATFQFESGDRLEMELEAAQYGLIVEGDRGNLTFRGSRFLGFERT